MTLPEHDYHCGLCKQRFLDGEVLAKHIKETHFDNNRNFLGWGTRQWQ
jgi:hypothetical protein